jgi:hypothetical protein
MLRNIIYVLLPLVTVVAVVFLHLLAWCVYALHKMRMNSDMMSIKQFMEGRIRVIVMVVLFFFYPSLLRVCLSMFACYPLDVAGQGGPGSMYAAANATYGYWVYDMQQACWQGWHLKWALGLGVGGVVLCLGVPAVVAWWLISNKARINDPGFRLHYGFLYRNFRRERCFWEAVVALQTAALVSVAVYSSVVGVYFELLMFAFVFSMIVLVQLWHRPYAFRRLHHLYLMATGLLYATAFIALSFIEVEKPSHRIYREVIGVVLLLMIGAFFLWCCYNIYAVRWGALTGWAGITGCCMNVRQAASSGSCCLTTARCRRSCFERKDVHNKDPLHEEIPAITLQRQVQMQRRDQRSSSLSAIFFLQTQRSHNKSPQAALQEVEVRK